MEVLKSIELTRIDEIRILQNVRLIHRHDLNPVYSKDNLRVQFDISGDIKGGITCHLCLDGEDLSTTERNYIFPLFVEAMNILVGRQVSLDGESGQNQVKLSSPKLSMIPKELNTSLRTQTQKYSLELEDHTYLVLAEYSLEALN